MGSAIAPSTAEAATVAEEPIYIFAVGSPMRPLKFRVDAVTTTFSEFWWLNDKCGKVISRGHMCDGMRIFVKERSVF